MSFKSLVQACNAETVDMCLCSAWMAASLDMNFSRETFRSFPLFPKKAGKYEYNRNSQILWID